MCLLLPFFLFLAKIKPKKQTQKDEKNPPQC
nr:MAG TPA: hypothetical protein [Bacteriophage sp.]